MKWHKNLKRTIAGGALLLGITSSAMAAETQVHGFVSQGFLGSKTYNFLGDNTTSGTWEMREVGINAQREVGERFRVGLQLLSRDVGVYGNNKINLDWAYGNVYIHDMLNISIGRNKLPLGFYSETQDFDFLTPHAIMPSTVYDKGLRSLTSASDGIRLKGNFDFGNGGNLDYNLSVGDINLGPDTDVYAYTKTLGMKSIESIDTRFIVSPNIVYNTPLSGLRLNLTYLRMNELIYKKAHIGSHPQLGDMFTDVATDLNWFYAGLQYLGNKIDATFEWHHRYSVTDNNVYTNAMSLKNVEDTVNKGGGYVSLSVKPKEWFNVGIFYDLYTDRYDDTSNVQNAAIDSDALSNYRRDLGLTTTFKVNTDLVIKMEGHFVQGHALLPSSLNSEEMMTNPDEENWFYGLIKASYSF